jgi:hypothetical protein
MHALSNSTLSVLKQHCLSGTWLPPGDVRFTLSCDCSYCCFCLSGSSGGSSAHQLCGDACTLQLAAATQRVVHQQQVSIRRHQLVPAEAA